MGASLRFDGVDEICLLCRSSKLNHLSFRTSGRFVEKLNQKIFFVYKISQHRSVNRLNDQFRNYHIKEHFDDFNSESSVNVQVNFFYV